MFKTLKSFFSRKDPHNTPNPKHVSFLSFLVSNNIYNASEHFLVLLLLPLIIFVILYYNIYDIMNFLECLAYELNTYKYPALRAIRRLFGSDDCFYPDC